MPVVKRLKRLWKRAQTATFIVALLFIAGLYISVVHPQWSAWINLSFYIPLFSLSMAILCLLYANTPKRCRFRTVLSWQMSWWGGAFLLWGVWIANVLAWLMSGPMGIQNQIPQIETTLLALWQHYAWGYPWLVYGLVAFCYRLFLNQEPEQAIPESLTKAVFRGRLQVLAALMAGMMVSLCTQLALALTALSILLLGLQLVDQFFSWPSHLSLGIWLLAFLGFFAALNRFFPWKKLAHWSTLRGIGFWSWTVFILLLLGTLLLGFKYWAFSHLPDASLYLKIESVVGWKMNHWALPIERLEALIWAWWLLWTPLIASYWARISKNIPLIWVALMALLMPFIMNVLPIAIIAIGFVKRALLSEGYAITACLLLLLVVLLGLTLWGQNNAKRFLQGWLTHPKSKTIKVHGLSKMLPFWVTLLANLLLFHAMGGWYLIQLQILGPAILLAFCILGVNASLLLKIIPLPPTLSSHKYGNQNRH